MNAAVILLVLAFIAANLPFLSERRLLVLPSPNGKTLSWRLLELVGLYFIVGLVAWLVERNMGAAHPQRWEFYAVTVCLFLVFAYPGYVYRAMWRKK